MSFNIPIQLRWSDFDPNFHLRHSVYYDWGAMCRMAFLDQNGLTIDKFKTLPVGLILFREECSFRKEIVMGDEVHISLHLLSAKKDFSRFSIRHRITRGADILCATLVIDAAWISVKERKLAIPPPEAGEVFGRIPQDEEFKWQE